MAGPTPHRYVPYNITVPAFRTASFPLRTNLAVPLVWLVDVRIYIPPGHAGVTGIRLDTSGGTILPFSNPATFITGDDRDLVFVLDTQSDSTMQWVCINNGPTAHTFYILLHVTDLSLDSSPPASIIGLVG